MSDSIEKPWAVYGWFLGSMGIGKITKEFQKSLFIKYAEEQMYPPECWNSKWAQRFDNPLSAINYFLEHPNYSEKFNRSDPDYLLKTLVKSFLSNFPSETKNIETLLAQSSPKLTEPKKNLCHGCMRKEKPC